MSYIRNDAETGAEIILVRLGLLIHREMVTKDDATMGMILYHLSKVLSPKDKLTTMNSATHKGVFAHFFELRL